MSRKKKLTTAEKMKIINADPELWLLNFVKIVDEQGNIINFKVNAAQKDFLKNKSKYNCILKSRRLGFSTLSLGLMLYSAYQKPFSTYMMVAHDKDTLRELFNTLKFMQNSIPDNIRLKETKNNRDELELSNGSRIIVKCPDDTMGAGMRLNIIHLSEYGLWSEKYQETGLVTLEQSLAKTDDSMIIIESTARGYNHFHKIYTDAEKSRNRYKPFFYSWCNRTHLNQFRVEVEEAVEWYKSINKGNPLSSDPLELTQYERMLLEKTNVTLKQLMWRQYKLLGMSKKLFMQEYPAFPEEAFASTVDSNVFDTDIVNERMYYIPEPLKNVSNLPLDLQRYLANELRIYKTPEPNMWYFMGVDVALGNKRGDDSAICILDTDGEQVAVFNSNSIPTYRFADIVAELGHYYNSANIMVERNSFGIDILQRLHKEKQYVNLARTRKQDRITGRTTWEMGWYQTNVNKTILVNDLKESFETGLILVNDKITLEQMKIYVEDKGKFGNLKGEENHDDLVDALGLAVQSMKLNRYYV